MDKEADPVRLLQREDRLPEWKQRYQNEPFERRGQDSPRHSGEGEPSGMPVGGPFSEHSEEDQRPGEVRPLMKGDTDRDGSDRWFRSQGPVARRYGGDRHPINNGIAPDSGGRKLTDDR